MTTSSRTAAPADPDLRTLVEARLRKHVEREFGGDSDATTRKREARLPEDLPSQIGPYRLLDKLGEGGMGEVWLAEQTEPVRRKVALKVIKQGMDTKQVVARFEAERQALAMMDHPAIAKIYEAGATPNGRPYFVMEHVPGVPITEYCDRHKLTNRQRLVLFMQVCEGVQHAHHKAVIHRDLKPSNVLVTVRDDKPVPKIIDFGVAKATAQRLTERSLHTRVGVLIGTPAYMSPEQAQLTGEDIDTRTDVYALGVMLYELLVGALPFDPAELRRVGFEAMVRIICDEEPARPSTRLTTMGEHSTQSAARRRTDLPALKRELSGDLDWITMKALEKDRTRRYSSPQDLAADIERYRTDQPVLASPPSAAYRTRKFVRRHTAGVAAAAIGLVVLVVFALTMTVLRGAAEDARADAQSRAEELELVTEFQASMLSDIDAEEMGTALYQDLGERIRASLESKGSSATEVASTLAVLDQTLGHANATDVALELIDEQVLSRAVATIEEEFADQPVVQAALQQTVANTYRDIGLYSQAMPLQETALETRRRVLGNEHVATLASLNNLARLTAITAATTRPSRSTSKLSRHISACSGTTTRLRSGH